MRYRGPYVIDTNVFIQAANHYYAFDIVPSFWPKLVELAGNGRILTIDRVRTEIEKGGEELAKWIIRDFPQDGIVSSSDERITRAVELVMQWVYDSQRDFFAYARNAFASSADPWVIAYSVAYNCCVVTQEEYKADIKRKVPIPNVCRGLDIPCVDTFAMMRELYLAP